MRRTLFWRYFLFILCELMFLGPLALVHTLRSSSLRSLNELIMHVPLILRILGDFGARRMLLVDLLGARLVLECCLLIQSNVASCLEKQAACSEVNVALGSLHLRCFTQ